MPLFIKDCVTQAITTKAEKLSTYISNNKVPRPMEDLTGRNVSFSYYHLFKIAKLCSGLVIQSSVAEFH